MTTRVAAAHDRLQQAVDELRAITATATGTELCGVLTTVEAAQRSLDQVSVAALARIDREGVFTEHGYRSASGALADLLRWEPRRSRRFVTAAEQIVARVGLDGQTLPARLEATADGAATGQISMRHVEVIAALLDSAPARRLAPDTWAGAEQELAAHAGDYTPTELHAWGVQLLEALDQDGPGPDDDPDDDGRPTPQINEVHLARHRNRPGGTIKGRFDDAEMFDRVAAAIDTHGRPRDTHDVRSPAERQAEGLAEICGYALAHGPSTVLPETGGRRPQLVVTIRLEDLEQRARTGMLEFGGQTSPETLRMIACDTAVIPVVLGGKGEPLDIGRATRTIPEPLRRAVTTRDRGCAHPGCDLPPAWCQIHHIVAWAHHGETRIDNLVMLCAVHHRLVHHSGWDIRIVNGRPEFIPPGWIDAWRRPRRKPDPNLVVDLGGHSEPGTPTTTSGVTAMFDDLPTAAAPCDPVSADDINVPRPREGVQRVVDFDDLDREPTDVELGATTTRAADFDDLGATVVPQARRGSMRVVDFSGLEIH